MPTTIAIIEDNLEFLRHFSAVVDASDGLRLLGVAGNGRDGMALIERERADLYLIDLGLPDMDGVELIRHAQRRHPDCDVVVVTVFGDDAHVMASIEAGATGYLLKDSAPAALLDCVRVLREGGAPVSPVIARKILQRLGKGLSFNEIGDMYTISPHTVARHVKNIYKKLAVHSRGEAVYEATALGLL